MSPDPGSGTSSSSTGPGAPAPGTGLGVWLGFAPLAAVVGLRWVLQWLDDRTDAAPAWPLAPFVGTQDPLGWLPAAGWTLGALALLILAAWWLRRRHGARVLWRWLAGLWLAVALAACAGQLLHFLNLRGLQAQPQALAAQVLGSRAVPPSARGPGGTLLVLQLPGEAPQQALVGHPGAAALTAGQPLALHWARGRWWGRYVTGWPDAGPAASATSPDNPRP
ncbi:hypothetical protein GCM10027019_22900 [Melaminivora jejuensis]|uniref:hypothetical protein n=1 Tax=Melaminivora jejuensis TaxID=1267217 RepID=UPI001ADEE940|nr:hypothetical protein [Melaminivora jejuensis]UHJ64556.1 hypothetical protein LVC68_14570 [Melaminivora jejuensis]